MKKVFVTGSGGLVGSRFVELASKKYQLFAPEINELNLLDQKAVQDYIAKSKPDVIVHLAAYTDVSEAEIQRGDIESLSWKVNVEGTRNLVESVGKVHFIHISTDMVFPGSTLDSGPYTEDHHTNYSQNELTWYGYTKLQSEKIVLDKFGSKATIIRLIYPVRAKFEEKLDYLRKPLKLFDEGKLYPMFTNQQVSISFIDEIAALLATIIDKKLTGIFHASSNDCGSPFEIIGYLIEKARGVEGAVKPSSIDGFLKTVDNPLRYPRFGGLRVYRTEKETGIKFSSWKEIIDKLVEQGIGGE